MCVCVCANIILDFGFEHQTHETPQISDFVLCNYENHGSSKKNSYYALITFFFMLAMVAVRFDGPDEFSPFLGYNLISGKSFQSALSIFTVNGPS